jgi:hypothetical protein
MKTNPAQTNDPIDAVRQLRSPQLVERISNLEAEIKSLRVLLRAARARERAEARSLPSSTRLPASPRQGERR